MSTYNTITDYPGDGVTVQFAVNFPYIALTDIVVYLDGVKTAAFTTDGVFVTMDTAPATGVVVSVRREIDRTSIANLFGNRAVLTNQDLDDNSIQIIYGLQEDFDKLEYLDGNLVDLNDAVTRAETAADESEAARDEAVLIAGGDTVAVTANYSVDLPDLGKILIVDSASPVSIDVKDDATVGGWGVKGNIGIVRKGAGTVTITEGGSTTILYPETLELRKQNSIVTLIKTGTTDEWVLAGDIVTV